MIELFEQDIKTLDRQSSKGMQLKWKNNNTWYKADNLGYEGIVEYVISKLLKYSTLNESDFVEYETEMIFYKRKQFLGCASKNFLPEGWQLITLERLFQNYYGTGLNRCLYSIQGYNERIKFLVDQTIRITGLSEFGIYMSKLLAIDAFFMNEDRHTHNIAVLLDDKGEYHYCPFFDNGAALLSDTTMDYPMEEDIYQLIEEVEPKTFAQDFDIQLETVENVYGNQLKFNFNKKDVEKILESESFYDDAIKNRIKDIIFHQMRKYSFLFV